MKRPSVHPLWLMGAAAGIVVDRLCGEPPSSLHPLVYFGRAMNRVESVLYRGERRPGVLHTLAGTALGITSGLLVRSTTVASYVAVGGRALGEAASAVATAVGDANIEGTRELLPSLVGRDASNLDATEISRATVESVAENTVDAIVAPVMWAALCGPAGALGYRAINTMDAMVGHHSTRYENYGWASARLDDVVNFVPARITAVLVAMVRPRAAMRIIRGILTQAPLHPSPNSGVGEVAFAAALGLRLGGRNRYGARVEDRPVLGFGRPAQARDIDDAVRLSRDVSFALAAVLSLLAVMTWQERRCR
jgi:adenosylcobinamide-phosphate synthase